MPTKSRIGTATHSAPWLFALLAVAAVPLLLHETFLEMVRQWDTTDAYKYGYLICPPQFIWPGSDDIG